MASVTTEDAEEKFDIALAGSFVKKWTAV